MYRFFCLFCVHAVFYGGTFSNGLQCMDQNNQPVDWFVIYKFPKQKSSSYKYIEEGMGYMYMTSENYSKWTFSDVDINDTTSLVARTLDGLYTRKNDQANLYILYNDQPPYGPKSESKGHTKGVVMADSEGGFWLIHSVPHFPHSLESYVYPTTGVHFGQSFLCISLDLGNLDSVGTQLQYNEPHIYAQNVPPSLSRIVPEISKAADNLTIGQAPWFNVVNITTKIGTKFLSFAKAGKFHKDLYSDLVSPQVQGDLYVETWPNEPNRLPSECGKKFQVDNIVSISVPQPEVSFTTTVDHSKWAVTIPKDLAKWICIGDINRAERQTERGGGTTCLNNDKLASQYQKIVSTVEKCRNYNEYYRV